MPFVCIKTFPNRAEAEIARNALGAEGIPSMVIAEDIAYDITLACGGARLLVDADAVDAAREILATFDSSSDDSATAEPIRFRLSALFVLTTVVALAAAGYAYHGPDGAIDLFVAAILVIISVQVLLSLEGRRPLKKFFVAVAGLGMLIYAIVILVNLVGGTFD